MARKTTPVVSETGTEGENEMESNLNGRTTPVTLTPVEGGNNVLAAWQGLYNLFGAQAERFDITHEGVVVVDLTFDGQYDPDRIIYDISGRNRHVPLVPSWFYLQGENPEPFTDPLDMTKWMAQYFRREKGAGSDESKSPQYVKDAIAAYKKEHNFPGRKGRKKTTVKIEELGEIEESLLAGVSVEELTKLRAKVNSILGNK